MTDIQNPARQTNVDVSACIEKLERLTSNTGRDYRSGQEFVHAGESQEIVDAMREALDLLKSTVPQEQTEPAGYAGTLGDMLGRHATPQAQMEVERLRRMVERRDEFIIGKGLWDQFKEASREAE